MSTRTTGICRRAIWRADLQDGDGSGTRRWRLYYRGKSYTVHLDGLDDAASDEQVRRAAEQTLAGLERATGSHAR